VGLRPMIDSVFARGGLEASGGSIAYTARAGAEAMPLCGSTMRRPARPVAVACDVLKSSPSRPDPSNRNLVDEDVLDALGPGGAF